jgi:hypothetical protein
MRAPFAEATLAERQFRDGTHGFLVWALGVVISAIVVSYAAGALTRTGVEATSNVVGGAAQGSAVAGVSSGLANATDPMGYVVDRLFRPATTEPAESATPAESTDNAPATAATATPAPEAATAAVDSGEEVSRIFVEGLANDGLAADDRAYLSAQVAARTGLPPAEAEKRVDDAFATVRQAEAEARQAVDDARRAAAIGAFLTAAALLIAAAAAAAGAGLGGRHRDENGALRLLGRERFW